MMHSTKYFKISQFFVLVQYIEYKMLTIFAGSGIKYLTDILTIFLRNEP